MSVTFTNPSALWLLFLILLTVGLALLGPRRPTRARFWGGLALRVFLLILLILSLAGIQVRTPTDILTVVFVLDVSDSISPEDRDHGEAIIREALQNMPQGDKAAIVVFGEQALIEQLISETRNIPEIASVPITTRTDIESALQLALALFPDEGAKRIVLLSDGRQNIGEAIDQAEISAAHGIDLSFVPLGNRGGEGEVLIENLEAPVSVRQGQNFQLMAVIHSDLSTDADLRVLADGRLVQSLNVNLDPGNNRFKIPIESSESGFRRFSAQIIPDIDTRLQNNQSSAFTVVYGPPHILIVVNYSSESSQNINETSFDIEKSPDAFARALEAAKMQVTTLPANQMPINLSALADFDAIILLDVPATSIPVESMYALNTYVRDLGRGLLMTGGEQSFGAGGYLRTPIEEALPVYMDVRNKEQQANLALVLAVDKSGSMGRCHCDDPDLNQSYTRQESGQPKVDIAKEAIMRAAGALGELDFLGVVSFDSAAKWAVKTQKLVDPYSLENAIGSIPAQGQTNLQSGVEAAYQSLLDIDAQRKHIILLTDGWVHQTALLNQASDMEKEGITLSVVAAGGGSASYLEELAHRGGGTYYAASDIMKVPDFFLKETVTAVGRYVIEEPFYPLPGMSSPILMNLNPMSLPPLYGYNGTTPKSSARLDLITPQGDPLLVTWQYGLGRAAAWTSDVENRWASQWLGWNEFPSVAAQLVGWTLPAPKAEGLTASAWVEENRGVIDLEAVDENGSPLNFLFAHASMVGPDLNVSEIELSQIGPGHYQAELALSKPGTYLVRLGVNQGDHSLGQEIIGLVVPYSPEYRVTGIDLPFLKELARITGGDQLTEPIAAYVHDLKTNAIAREIWQPLLLVVAILFPIDVAIRRVILSKTDYLKAVNWLRARINWRKTFRNRGSAMDSQMRELFAAKDRARLRQDRNEKPDYTNHVNQNNDSERSNTIDSQVPAKPELSKENHTEETISRLKDAKKRARREE
jgi:uncharacterized membrane protein